MQLTGAKGKVLWTSAGHKHLIARNLLSKPGTVDVCFENGAGAKYTLTGIHLHLTHGEAMRLAADLSSAVAQALILTESKRPSTEDISEAVDALRFGAETEKDIHRSDALDRVREWLNLDA